METETTSSQADKQIAPVDKISWQEAVNLVQKHISAKKLTDKDLTQIRKALKDQPGLWRLAGDMALQAQMRMVEKLVSQPVAELSIEHGLDRMREGLGRHEATMLEKLLIDQVVICWLNMYDVQQRYTLNMTGDMPISRANYWEKRLTTVQARYLKAIETLARVRRLMRVVPVQVNLAQQQINVANTR